MSAPYCNVRVTAEYGRPPDGGECFVCAGLGFLVSNRSVYGQRLLALRHLELLLRKERLHTHPGPRYVLGQQRWQKNQPAWMACLCVLWVPCRCLGLQVSSQLVLYERKHSVLEWLRRCCPGVSVFKLRVQEGTTQSALTMVLLSRLWTFVIKSWVCVHFPRMHPGGKATCERRACGTSLVFSPLVAKHLF